MAYGTAISNKTGVKDMESEGENSSLFVRQAVAIFQPCTGMVEILSY